MKPDTLLPTLTEALTELGPASNLAALQQGLRALAQPLGRIPVSLYVSVAVTADRAHPFWALCPGLWGQPTSECGDYQLQLCRSDALPPRCLGQPIAPLALVVLDENLPHEPQLLYHLRHHAPQYAARLVLRYAADGAAAQALRGEPGGTFVVLDMDVPPAPSLAALLTAQLPPPLPAQLRAKCYLNTVQPLLQLTRETVQHEQYVAGVRRNFTSQLGAVLRRDEAGANVGDTVASLKTQLQHWHNEAEKTIRSKYEELNKPITGRYSQQLSQWADHLPDLERSPAPDRDERLLTTVPAAFMRQFEQQVGTELADDFALDYGRLRGEAEVLLDRLNAQLEQKGIVRPGSRTLHLDARFPNPDHTLRNYVSFARPYGGELAKRGATEYLAALREHTSSIMAAVALLAPLNMIASVTFTEVGPPGFRVRMAHLATVLKDVRAYIQLATALLIIGMLVWGYFDLRKRIPRRRAEELDREMRRARETLQTEGRRMVGEATKDWQGGVGQWLREVYGQVQGQLDQAVREYGRRQQQLLDDERAHIQQQSQALDAHLRRVATAERLVETAQRVHRDAVSEVEKSFH